MLLPGMVGMCFEKLLFYKQSKVGINKLGCNFGPSLQPTNVVKQGDKYIHVKNCQDSCLRKLRQRICAYMYIYRYKKG